MRLVSGSLKLPRKSCTFFVVIIYLFNLALGSEECSDENLKAFENELQFPCGGRKDSKAESVLGEALNQLFILNRYLNSTLFELDKYREFKLEYISDGRTYSKVNTMLTRLENEKKVRVFYNMLRRIGIHVYHVFTRIPEGPFYKYRQRLYKDLLCNLKLVTCEFKGIQTRDQKDRQLPSLSLCSKKIGEFIFDYQLFASLKLFFTESYEILHDVYVFDKTILFD
ncbi:uncharacterized protein [Diabrotica undecimpunctata]|uniref:uncharacterized protein n=1 Tax=Diabrotica undecimpunctata TaxID=50387 RepID=UPI003B63D99E